MVKPIEDAVTLHARHLHVRVEVMLNTMLLSKEFDVPEFTLIISILLGKVRVLVRQTLREQKDLISQVPRLVTLSQ